MKFTLLISMLAAVATNPLTCSQPIYLPNKIQVPIFPEQGKFYANGSYAGNSGYGLTLAYSPIKSLFVEGGGNISPVVKPFVSSNSTKFFYGALGYYMWPSSFASVELSGGYGKGFSETYDSFPEDIYDTSYQYWYDGQEFDHKNIEYDRFHLQASLGFHGTIRESTNGNHAKDFIVEGALTPRLTYLKTTKYAVDHFDTSKVLIGSRTEDFSNVFLEFGITLRMGVEYLMVELQSGSSSVIDRGSNRKSILSQGSFLSVGLVSRF